MQRGRRSRRSGRGRRPHHRPRCATLLYPCLSRPAHGRLRSVYVVVPGTRVHHSIQIHTTKQGHTLNCVGQYTLHSGPQIAPHGTHTRRKNRRANGTHAAHRDARQRPMQLTVPRSTAGDSRSAAACTVVGGEGRQPAAGAAKACRPRRRPSWREGSWWARQVRERAAESADGPCRCGCYP